MVKLGVHKGHFRDSDPFLFRSCLFLLNDEYVLVTNRIGHRLEWINSQVHRRLSQDIDLATFERYASEVFDAEQVDGKPGLQ